ncbi:penicillin-binding protein 2 [Fictibacillus sp. Mic-4]|uniref:peptidoglycan D,D-transpeptidase FtsI family protein n=1 Tax=Fictibacillus sp. Mic-4 TaxID=3132826 RepID=UPI003CE98A0B
MQKKKKKSHVPFRLNALFLSVFLLFSILIFRLGYVQIVKGAEYKQTSDQTDNVTTKLDAPRGKIYDRDHRVVVNNKPVYSITYTRMQNSTAEDRLKLAEKLSHFIHKDTSEVTERDKKDFFILLHKKEVEKRITAKEKKKLNDDQIYQLELDRVTKKDLDQLTDHQLEVLAIKRELDGGYSMSPQRVKVGVTEKEIARISEHLKELPGIDIKPDAQRDYPFGNSFKGILGQVKQIPKSKMDYYLARGNDRNDLVGTSFLEEQYESVLRGKKSKIEYMTDKAGNPIGDPIEKKGERGDDLVLTVDMDFQKKVENIIESELKESKSGSFAYANRDLKEAYVTVMNPNTGEILAMAGKQYDPKTGRYKNDPYGNVYDSFAAGSVVKGATVLAGLQSGVITPNTHFYDAPLNFGDGRVMKSVENMGSIGPLTALERSSNVYMWNIAMRLAGYDYSKKRFIHENVEGAFRTLRNTYAQFGLGVPTGIDLPSEATGYHTGISDDLAQAMFFAIGQFDTYTPLQLAQYVSTIANDGYRMQPHLVKEIREPSEDPNKLGKLVTRIEPNVLNRIDMKKSDIELVQKGFRLVMSGAHGTAAPRFSHKSYMPAGKSGTAQVDIKTGMDNRTLIAYAPYKHPEVAISVVVPNVRADTPNYEIGEKVLDTYFEMKDKGEPTK